MIAFKRKCGSHCLQRITAFSTWLTVTIIIPLTNHSCTIHKLTCSRKQFNLCVSWKAFHLPAQVLQTSCVFCKDLRTYQAWVGVASGNEVAYILYIYQWSLKYNANRSFHAHVIIYRGNREVSVFSFKRLTVNCWFLLPTDRILNFTRQIWSKKI